MSKAIGLTTEQRQDNYERQGGTQGLTVKQQRQIRRQERRRLAVARRRSQ